MPIGFPILFKRKNSSIFYAKKETPAELWGKRDELAKLGIEVIKVTHRSMGTAIKKDALRKEVEFYAELEEQWAGWRKVLKEGPLNLTQKQVFAIVSECIAEARKDLEDNPGNPRTVNAVVDHFTSIAKAAPQRFKLQLRQAFKEHLAKIVKLPPVSEDSLDRLVEQALKDMPQALENRKAMVIEGDYRPPAFLKGRPSVKQAFAKGEGVGFTFDALVDNWINHGRGNIRPATKSLKKYRQQAERLQKFVGHNRADRVTYDDAGRFLTHISKPDANGKLPAHKHTHDMMMNLSTLYAKAVKARKLLENPFKDQIPAKQGKGETSKRRAFTDEEARIILLAARKEADTFRRWAPFLMCYSGMRVTEAGQLRKRDVEVGGDRAFIHLRHEAGHVKNGKNRIVPVHPALEAEGFLEFVKSCKVERLFPQVCLDPKGNRFNKEGEPNDSKAHELSRWVWSLGFANDGKLAPAHSWRHRFKQNGEYAGMQQGAIDRIVGHEKGDIHVAYQGSMEERKLKEMLTREMLKFPTLSL